MSPSKKSASKKPSNSKALATTTDQPAIVKEEQPDIKLVEEAYNKLEGIVKDHIMMAMIDAGQYIIEKFYDDDYDNARNNKKVKIKSLAELIRRIKENSDGTPSKTWIYDAVKLAVDDYDYKNNNDYKQIGHSHKVALTHVQDKEIKEKLIKETADKEYSVVKLKERIQEEKGALTLSELPSDKELKKLGEKKLNSLVKQITWRLGQMEKTLEKYRQSKEKLDAIIEEVKSANPEKAS